MMLFHVLQICAQSQPLNESHKYNKDYVGPRMDHAGLFRRVNMHHGNAHVFAL